MKPFKERPHKPNSIPYYIDAVIDYRAKYETDDRFKNSNPPIMTEMLLSILISIRALRNAFSILLGLLLFLLVKLALVS